jgi:hypothetical protein
MISSRPPSIQSSLRNGRVVQLPSKHSERLSSCDHLRNAIVRRMQKMVYDRIEKSIRPYSENCQTATGPAGGTLGRLTRA